jgi:hypothetical protein
MRILLADAEPGMVLREPAENHQGQILLPAGAELAQKHLRILQSWGVGEIEVEESGDTAVAGESGPVDEHLERIRDRFRKVREDPILEQILGVLLNRARSVS